MSIAGAVHFRAHAQAGHRLEGFDPLQAEQASAAIRPDDGRGEGVLGPLLDGRRRADGFLFGDPEGHDLGHLGPALGQRAGLVEGDGLDAAAFLQVGAALDEHAVAGRVADGGDDGDRRGDDQRTGAGDDQQHQRPVEPRVEGLPRQRGNDGDGRRYGQDDGRIVAREAVDELLGRRLAALGFLDHVHDLRDACCPRRRM